MSREEFEDALLTSKWDLPLGQSNGRYSDARTQLLWEGWKLARKMPTEFEPLAQYYRCDEIHALVIAQSRQIDRVLALVPSNGKKTTPPPQL